MSSGSYSVLLKKIGKKEFDLFFRIQPGWPDAWVTSADLETPSVASKSKTTKQTKSVASTLKHRNLPRLCSRDLWIGPGHHPQLTFLRSPFEESDDYELEEQYLLVFRKPISMRRVEILLLWTLRLSPGERLQGCPILSLQTALRKSRAYYPVSLNRARTFRAFFCGLIGVWWRT